MKQLLRYRLLNNQSSFRKWQLTSVCLSILVVQFVIMVHLYIDYNDLLLLSHSSHPETFWYNQNIVSIRRASKTISLSNDFVVVIACARDVKWALPKFRSNLEAILGLFRDYRVVVGESASSDGTLAYLRNWALENSKIHIRAYSDLTDNLFVYRANHIAHCRNDLLKTVRRKNWLASSRFLLVMDVDINANDILTVDNFLSNFEYDLNDWAVMTASQSKRYYDIWALRSTIVNYDCWAVVNRFKHKSLAEDVFIYVHSKPIPANFTLISVQSAFGGFGVYQTKYLANCRYEAWDNATKVKCEHVSFNECIVRNGGRIFINPKFQNAEGTKH